MIGINTNPMVRILRKIAGFTMGLLFISAPLSAGAQEVSGPDDSLFPKKTLSLSGTHFTWGAELGSSLDMTSHNLSTFDVDVVLGYKSSLIKCAGIGAGIHRSIHTGNNFIPLYAVFRTGVTRKPTPFFINLQGGYCFSKVGFSGNEGYAGDSGHSKTVGDFYSCLGVGWMFKNSGVARPYVMLSAACQYFSDKNLAEVELDRRYIIFANLVIGVNF